MPIQYLSKAEMNKEPVLIRRFSLNQQALHAQEYLKNKGVEAFIFMDATWSGGGETQQGIRLVVKPSDANQALRMLHTYDSEEESLPFLDNEQILVNEQILGTEQILGNEQILEIEQKDGRFYFQVAWLVSILFAFLLGSFLTDKSLDGTEMAVGCVCLVAAGYFFFVANMQKRKLQVEPAEQ